MYHGHRENGQLVLAAVPRVGFLMADEANLVAIGMFKQTRILFGVRGVRGERDRIVSARARAATSAEELFYEQGS